MLLCTADNARVQGSNQLTSCLCLGDTCFACAQNASVQQTYIAHAPMFMCLSSCLEKLVLNTMVVMMHLMTSSDLAKCLQP